MADKKPMVMMPEDWCRYNKATECHICNESLVKAEFGDFFDVYNPNTSEYNGQSHKKCYYQARKGFVNERQPKGPNSEHCMFCRVLLLVNNYKDVVKEQCHITGKYWGAAHNACNLKHRLNCKAALIPVVFHNLKGYNGHLLIQAMARVQGEIRCIPNNTKKYISFLLGNTEFMDSSNLMMSSLDALAKGTAPEDMQITDKTCEDGKKKKLLLKKGTTCTSTWTALKGSPRQGSWPKKSSSQSWLEKG